MLDVNPNDARVSVLRHEDERIRSVVWLLKSLSMGTPVTIVVTRL